MAGGALSRPRVVSGYLVWSGSGGPARLLARGGLGGCGCGGVCFAVAACGAAQLDDPGGAGQRHQHDPADCGEQQRYAQWQVTGGAEELPRDGRIFTTPILLRLAFRACVRASASTGAGQELPVVIHARPERVPLP